ncbi:coiled-coil domain-containing protein 81 isoform X2 [Athene cunicularia]|uniref:coiled-coil domain-containing protein 81 isoform X2 n=1 Tax=Athene cunicularia TaxID=194338 RepID=UPI000EF71599|nr:coiled-coil domain-containing protein 81 isoform X2 [Athene cunicularia]
MRSSQLLNLQRPIFQLSENFAWVHGLQYEGEIFPGSSPRVLLNYTSVSLDTRIPPDTVQRCIQETLLFLSYTLANKQNVDFIFKDIGCLRFQNKKVKMQFSAEFLRTLDSTGHLLKSLLSRPGTRDSAASGRKNTPSQTASGSDLVFPRVGLYISPGRAAREGPLQTHKGQLEKKGEASRKKRLRDQGLSLTSSSCSLSPARLPPLTVEGELGKAARAREPLRLLPVLEESSSRKGEEGKCKPSATAWPQTLPPLYEGHHRAGQAVHSLCMQRDERKLQALLAEERLQKNERKSTFGQSTRLTGRGTRQGVSGALLSAKPGHRWEHLWQAAAPAHPRHPEASV